MRQLNQIGTRGILKPAAVQQKFHLLRHQPPPDIAHFVERYWLIRWDLRGQPPYVQETLPYPCVNLVFERGNTRIWGIDTGTFQRVLQDQGEVFGVKFRAGCFYPFVQADISAFTDATLAFDAVFGCLPDALEGQIFRCTEDARRITLVDAFLRQHLPPLDPLATEMHAIFERIFEDRSVIRVDDLCAEFGHSKRSLQRLFKRYVGVSPKWAIQRCRLQEAAEILATQAEPDLAGLALALGYFDQAHFSKDFKAVIGCTPLEYARHSQAGLMS